MSCSALPRINPVSLLIASKFQISLNKSESFFCLKTLQPSKVPRFSATQPRFWCICCYSVAQSYPTLCDPMNYSTSFPILHYLPEFAQTHVHFVSDTINHLILSPPSPLALNLSQHQGLFSGVSSLYQVAKVLELQLQHQSSNEYSGLISFRID